MNQEEKKYLTSIELLGEQLKQAYQEAKKIVLPKKYQKIETVVTCGMGGSQLGVDLARHLFSQEIKTPIIQIKGYKLPKFIDHKTLVIIISYSGNTEEALSSAMEAKEKKAQMVIITSGGKLSQLAKKNQLPSYVFNPINNPSGQPRLGTGYLLGSFLAILKKLRKIEISDGQINNMATVLKLKIKTKKYSTRLKNRVPVIVASEFLQGNAHIFSNQINESAKQLAFFCSIPEMGHHLLEGLTFPVTNRKDLFFVFIFSQNYHPRNQKRYRITQKIMNKQKIKHFKLEFAGDKTEQAMKILKFGSLCSYELAKTNDVNPNKIPWVKYLKKHLK